MWTKPGWYETPEAVLASFALPLKLSLQQMILERLSEHESVSFSLKEAFAYPIAQPECVSDRIVRSVRLNVIARVRR